MSKAPKRPDQRNNRKRQDGEGGEPRSSASTRKPRPTPKRKAETVLDSLSTEPPSSVVESLEGNTVSSRPPVQGVPLAIDRSLVAEDPHNPADQQGPYGDSGDGANRQARTVAVLNVLASREPDQDVVSDPPHPSDSVEMRADRKHEPTQHHPMVHDLKSGSREDGKRPSRLGSEGTAQRAIRVWSPRLQAASDRVRGASGRVKVWAQERSARRAHGSDEALGSANPIYIVAAITLGIPAVLLIPLVGMNPGVQEGAFTTVMTFLVVSAFVTAAVFEIKRLADQSSDDEHH